MAERLSSVPKNSLEAAFEQAMSALGQKPHAKTLKAVQLAAQAAHPLLALLNVKDVPLRKVSLRGNWWRQDCGVLVAQLDSDRHPAALIPRSWGGYDLVDPYRRERWRVGRVNAKRIHAEAVSLYRAFPEKVMSLMDLVRFAASKLKRSLLYILVTTLLVSLTSMAIPWSAGMLFDAIIPAGSQRELVFLCVMLTACSIAGGLFTIARGFAILSLQGRISGDVQASIWDRLLHLPAPFFREFTSGDLLLRASSTEQVTRLLSGALLGVLFSGVFGFLYFFLLLHYSVLLTVAACLLTLLAALPMLAAVYKIRMQREFFRLEGLLSGFLLELLRGVHKLRVAGAETRAHRAWSRQFGDRCDLEYKVGLLDTGVGVWNVAFHFFSMMVLYATMMFLLSREQAPSTGEFIGFMMAYGSFLASVLALLNTGFTLASLVPVFERAKPILDTRPERRYRGVSPGKLSGKIAVKQLSFHYSPDEPMVLDRLSFDIQPGEFVAVVGPSGSGKSTLLRLLLGFEEPSAGEIQYDETPLHQLDLQAVRGQIGVVLQDSRPLPGTILENLTGSLPISHEAAWRALEKAGLHEDVKRMPMGIHTFVSEGGATLSGGQIQRLLIAKALIRQPRLLFFDEATSALDNQTQALVSANINAIHITRIVVAHRLSTIARADRILVLEKGRLVQTGTYEALIARDGLFCRLAEDQEL